eukprot:jgi/Bigna1/82417/fgenesh1_pg.92_\
MPIFIPSWTHKDGVCYYAICLEGQGLGHAAWRRYSEFDALCKEVKEGIPGITANTPPKDPLRKIFASKPVFVATRAHGLQVFLRRLLRFSNLRPNNVNSTISRSQIPGLFFNREVWQASCRGGGGRGSSTAKIEEKEEDTKYRPHFERSPSLEHSKKFDSLRLRIAQFILPNLEDKRFGTTQAKEGLTEFSGDDYGVQEALTTREEDRLRLCLQWIDALSPGVEGEPGRGDLPHGRVGGTAAAPLHLPLRPRPGQALPPLRACDRRRRRPKAAAAGAEQLPPPQRRLRRPARPLRSAGGRLRRAGEGPGGEQKNPPPPHKTIRRISRDRASRMTVNTIARILVPCLCPRSLPVKSMLSHRVEDALATLFAQADPAARAAGGGREADNKRRDSAAPLPDSLDASSQPADKTGGASVVSIRLCTMSSFLSPASRHALLSPCTASSSHHHQQRRQLRRCRGQEARNAAQASPPAPAPAPAAAASKSIEPTTIPLVTVPKTLGRVAVKLLVLLRNVEALLHTWYRREEGSKTYTFMVQGPFDPPLINLAVDLFHNWFPFLKSSKELKTVSRFHKQIQVTVKAPWPIWDREVLADCFGVNNLRE